MKLSFSQIKNAYRKAESIDIDPREFIEAALEGKVDFYLDGYRIIRDDCIHDVLSDELMADEYVLGSFYSSFLAEITGWPEILISAAQKGGGYADVGKAIIRGGFVSSIAEALEDEYGEHFSTYDGSEETVDIGEHMFYVFSV